MMDINAQLTLQTWTSAAFPTGAYTCSHGIETAISDNRINDAISCQSWIADIIQYGSGWNDAVLMANSHAALRNFCFKPTLGVPGMTIQADRAENSPDYQSLQCTLLELNELAAALCAGKERLAETTQLGDAFSKSAQCHAMKSTSARDLIDGSICLPIAMGVQGALSGIPIEQLLPASIQAASSNLVWISTRLIPLGQSQALDIIRDMQSIVSDVAEKALTSTLEDIGSSTLLADLASLEHKRIPCRICNT